MMLEDLNTVRDLKEKIKQLREGEEDGYSENTQSTPGQFLKRIHDLTPEKRLKLLKSLIDSANSGARCMMDDHAECIAHDAVNLKNLADANWHWNTARRLLGIFINTLREHPDRKIHSGDVANRLELFLSTGRTPDGQGHRVLCGHSWSEFGQAFECAEPVEADGGHLGDHSAYVREGFAADQELRMKYLEQENDELRRRLLLPPNPPRRHG